MNVEYLQRNVSTSYNGKIQVSLIWQYIEYQQSSWFFIMQSEG